ncbi:MAG: PPE family protein [Mycobacterium sp.]|nr:PPE family protein [Mycobacterium sp.]
MDFGALPPEINSARMYAGAGAAPMMAAAAAWNTLAAELSTTAAGYESVMAELTGEQWTGPAAAAAAAAVQPYVDWLNITAAHAQHAATQATASAAAYQTAFAMTVPPPEIAANRAQLAALVATNFLGINTPAIMATEAQYAEMWAQDAAAMYGYAAASARAAFLNPLNSPAPMANPAGVAGQTAAVTHAAAATSTQAGLNQLVSAAPSAVAALATPAQVNPIDSFLSIPFVANSINGAVDTAAWFSMNTIPTAVSLGHTLGTSSGAAGADALAGGLSSGALVNSVRPAASVAGVGGAPVLASLGRAVTVGDLTVPASWSAAAPAMHVSGSAVEGSGWAVAPEEGVTAVPAGLPAMATAGKSVGFSGPRYGIKPTVMPKQVFA